MKTHALFTFCALVAGLTSVAGADAPMPGHSAKPEYPQIELDSEVFTISAAAAERLGLTCGAGDSAAKYSAVLSATAYQKLTEALRSEKSMVLLSSPRLTTKSGQRAVIYVSREFRYPTAVGEGKESDGNLVPTKFETTNMGWSLDFEPVLAPGDVIDLAALVKMTEFNRFVAYEAGRTHDPEPIPKGGFTQPVFDEMWNSVSVSLRPGQTLLLDSAEWLGAPGRSIEEASAAGGARPEAPAKTEAELLFVAVTVRLIKVAPPHGGVDGELKAGGPVEITSELVNISRDRLPASMKGSAAGPPALAGVFTSAEAQEVRKALIANSGGEYSAAPKKAIASGGRFSVEATGLLRYPGKDAKTDGRTDPEAAAKSEMERMDFRIEVRPHAFQAGVIDLDITSSPTTSPASNEDTGLGSSAGMASAKWKFDDDHSSAAREPARSITTSVSIFDASPVVLARATEGREDHLQILLITAKSVNADERAKADAKKWPSALPVPGRPGFVTSPFKPAADMINVRGYPKGAELKDPYTGRTFLVP